MKNKKTTVAIISVIALVLVIIGVTYAYWLVTKTQTNKNTITTGCLDISITGEANDITLTNQFPLSDEDGMALTPYEFTITNNCTTSVDYQVALESMGTESTAIKSSAIKVALDEEVALLSNKAEVETTVSGAYAANRLVYGTLAAKSDTSTEDEVTYKLRIWIDADAPISEQNKEFTSKISVTVGQGIVSPKNPFEEGTLAYDIISNYGGVGDVTVIEETEVADRIVKSGEQHFSTSSNYYFGTEYTYDASTGKYTLSGDLVQATISECRTGTKTCGKYTLANSSSTYSSNQLYEVTNFTSSSGTGNVVANTIKYCTPFAAIATEAGLYKTTDDLGDSYYFRGPSTDNYVQFGSYVAGSAVNGVTYEKETPIYWRIVRINGDGSIRLIYDGTEKVANGTSHTATIGTTVYNDNSDDAKYLGYTYDTSTTDATQVDSTIKGVIDKWYNDHLKTAYSTYIEDSIFCNDRSGQVIDEYGSIDYATARRLQSSNPTLKCADKSDRYTVHDIVNGNGLLTNPVGLITADEVTFNGKGSTGFLYNNEYYWTSSPCGYDSCYAGAQQYIVQDSGGVISDYVNYSDNYNARPVINLRADVKFTGDGSYETPYEIVME